MANLYVGKDAQYKTIKSAVTASKPGDTIYVAAGTYVNDFSKINHGLTLIGQGDVKLVSTGYIDKVQGETLPPGETTTGKAFFQVAASDTETVTIRNFSFDGAANSYGSGSAIRFDTKWVSGKGEVGCNLIVQACNISNCQDGILGSDQMWNDYNNVDDPNLMNNFGSITVEGCVFENNGLDKETFHNHAIYIGDCKTAIFKDNTFNGTRDGAHIKSRASETIIDGNHMYWNGNNNAKEINLPAAGKVFIVNNVMVKGPNAENYLFLDYGDPFDYPYREGKPFRWSGQAVVDSNVFVSQIDGAIGIKNGSLDPNGGWDYKEREKLPDIAYQQLSASGNFFYGFASADRHYDKYSLHAGYGDHLGPVIESGSTDFASVGAYNGFSPTANPMVNRYWVKEEMIAGTAGNDDIVYVGTMNSAMAGDGEDRVRYNAGAKLIDGGAGGDTLVMVYGGIIDLADADQTSQDGAQVTGFEHVDASRSVAAVTLGGTADGNRLTGGNGDDQIIGGGGADTLEGGRGNDTLEGGSGGDRFVIATKSQLDRIVDFGAEDVIDLSGIGGFPNLAAVMAAATEVANAQNGKDVVLTLSSGNVLTLSNVTLSQLTDAQFIFSAAAPSTPSDPSILNGTDGNDIFGAPQLFSGVSVFGWGGDDQVAYRPDAKRLDGGSHGALGDTLITSGVDVRQISLGKEDQTYFDASVVTGFENVDGRNSTMALVLTGDDGNNFLIGGQNLTGVNSTTYVDRLSGGNGNDTLNGWRGDDSLTGGTGADLFIFESAGGNDVIIDFSAEDKILLAGVGIASFDQILAATVDSADSNWDGAADAKITLADGGTILIPTMSRSQLAASHFIFSSTAPSPIPGPLSPVPVPPVTIIGTSGNDRLTGNYLSNIIKGLAGNDTVHGGIGDDTIYGAAGNDWLNGGLGNDKLWGGLGKDVLTGSTGKDIFVFDTKPNKKTNLDRIADFNVKDDTIWLDNKYMAKLGKGAPTKPVKLNKKFFTIGDKAKDKNDFLVYNAKKGILYYDVDGSGTKAMVEIATLKKGLKMTYADFFVI